MNGYLGNFKTILTPVARKCKLLNSPAAGETCTFRKPFVSLHMVCMRKTRRNFHCYWRIFERFGIKTDNSRRCVYSVSFEPGLYVPF